MEIIDPALGRRALDADEFNASFTGVVLTFELGTNFTSGQAAARPVWQSYLNNPWHTRGQVCLGPGTHGLLIYQLLGLALPLSMKFFVDGNIA